MGRVNLLLTITVLSSYLLPAFSNADPLDTNPSSNNSTTTVADQVRPAVVTINADGRERGETGIGTGFIVSADGLIVTNLHVIGEGRRFAVQMPDGRELAVESVHASDRDLDLAVVKVKSDGKPLPFLKLADAGAASDGMPVVVIGNPLGLRNSIVNGVVSGRREIEGRSMLQLAVPIEPGNSGGPVVDMEGRVHGIVTMKSVVAKNLGFAVAIDMLKPLLERPNPVPMSRWLTIGAMDEREWETSDGANWQQRGGRILVSGMGRGFGGRSLCLAKTNVPEMPFELAVRVKLDDESGAAGLVFHSDGGDRHYGFYPSNGRMRLTRFDGPNVFTWKVLAEIDTPHYRPQQWNWLRVRVEAKTLQCFVNGNLVIESADSQFTSRRVGLAKFRDTAAEFKNFQVAATINDRDVDQPTVDALTQTIVDLPALTEIEGSHLAALSMHSEAAGELLKERARELERRADELRRIAADVSTQSVVNELRQLIEAGGESFDLLRAALLIARLDSEDVDVDAYCRQVDRMVREIRETLPETTDDNAKLKALDQYLFGENGFHGSRFDYYHRANSYMNRVLDDRVGLPITISVLYMELGTRLGLKLEGVGLPGHFVVRYVSPDGQGQLIDVFHEARRLEREDAARLVREHSSRDLTDDDLTPAGRKAIVLRMLGNLRGLAERDADREALIRYLDAMLAVDSDLVGERGMRAMIRFETGRRRAALADLDWFLEHSPPGLDLNRIRQLREYFETRNPPGQTATVTGQDARGSAD